MAPEIIPPEPSPLQNTPPATIFNPALATRILVLTLLTGLLLPILACTMAEDNCAQLRVSNQTPFDLSAKASPLPTDADSIPFPPTRQEFSSPNGMYRFVLSTEDNWASKQAIGELFIEIDGNRQSLWTCPLPHEYGPRFVLVSSQGQVLLLDEWINVASRYAVMLLSRESALQAQHSFDVLQEKLAVPRASIVEMARYGWWIAAPPTLDNAEETAAIETAGKVLAINLENGELSVVDGE